MSARTNRRRCQDQGQTELQRMQRSARRNEHTVGFTSREKFVHSAHVKKNMNA